MKQLMPVLLFFLLLSCLLFCKSNESTGVICRKAVKNTAEILPGDARMALYLPLLEGKRAGLVVNHASRVGDVLLPDTLLSLGVDVRCLFVPEHGFRGTADAGEQLKDDRDARTGLPLLSLYGKNKEPSPRWMDSIDVLIFDLQDVGVRFYTYLSTLHYCLEACAKSNTPLILLDRPNPNIRKVDGPLLDTALRSFVGMHPVPLLYGMTIGEYGKMIVGEGWLKTNKHPELTVIPCENYARDSNWVLPYRPSPNLPTERSILLYPSLALFEGTMFSVGRGTTHPFECFGAPGFSAGDFSFVPQPTEGARHPKHEGKLCRGRDLRNLPVETLRTEDTLRLEYLLLAYEHYVPQDSFFLPTRFFDLLAGTTVLRKQLQEGYSATEIRQSWQEDLTAFRQIRAGYLIY